MISMFKSEDTIDATTIFSKPDNCYSKSGSLVTANKESLRVHFNIFKKETSRFDVECYKEKQKKIETVALKINSSKKTLYLNLDDCADRLHISKASLRLNNDKKSFLALWIKKLNKTQLLDQINDHYQEITNHYKDDNNNVLTAIREMQFSHIPKRSLMKIVRIFHNELQFQTRPTVFELDIQNKHIIKYSLQHMTKIMASASIDNKYFLVNETLKKEISSGTYGVIFRLDNISRGTFSALKESRTNYEDYDDPELWISKAYSDVEREFENLQMLAAAGLKNNIQPPAYFSYYSETEPKVFSYVTYYFNGPDLFEATKLMPVLSRLAHFADGFTKLIYALYEIHEQDIFHNDIKPENILVEIDEKGLYRLLLGDMGSISQAMDMNKKFRVYEHTPIYTPFDPFGLKFDCKELKSIDVYQLGASFYMILTGNPPYLESTATDNYPDFSLGFDTDILEMSCSPQAILLLRNMCNPGSSKRFTIIDAVNYIKQNNFRWEK